MAFLYAGAPLQSDGIRSCNGGLPRRRGNYRELTSSAISTGTALGVQQPTITMYRYLDIPCAVRPLA